MKLLMVILLVALIKVMDHECNETNSEHIEITGEAF